MIAIHPMPDMTRYSPAEAIVAKRLWLCFVLVLFWRVFKNGTPIVSNIEQRW
jgi:hypothetical protein